MPAFFPHLCFSFSDPRHLLDDCRSSHPTTPPNTGNYLTIRHRMGAQMLEFAAFPQHMVDARELILQTVWASLWNWQLVDFGSDGRCHHAASDHSNSVAICLMKELSDLVHDFLRDLDSFCTGHDGVTAAGFQPSVEHNCRLSSWRDRSRVSDPLKNVQALLKGIRLHIHTKWHKHFFQLLDLTRVPALRTIRGETFPLWRRSEQCLNCN